MKLGVVVHVVDEASIEQGCGLGLVHCAEKQLSSISSIFKAIQCEWQPIGEITTLKEFIQGSKLAWLF
ncbi:hypothetical protein H4K35_02245 [Myroides sp. NP-2]|uniref:hypothetical protein n=1 Tax=Myroides sp. NP-2 TaxID=2759945 RepID=UPI0015FD92CD|nr:hypothetical protein [Myroides sp. NP-2]MBB1148958.1 hypothetical protein [Myroides sp. NP-2]